jgi:hypothetical protein
MSDHDRIIMLESERDELKLQNAELAHQLIDLALHGETWSKIITYLPVSVFEEILSVLEYGDKKHPGDEWKNEDYFEHYHHAMRHLEHWRDGACGMYLVANEIDSESGKSHLIHAAIRCMMAAALEKEK